MTSSRNKFLPGLARAKPGEWPIRFPSGGIIYHQDQDGAIVIHFNRIDKKADRIMTRIDSGFLSIFLHPKISKIKKLD